MIQCLLCKDMPARAKSDELVAIQRVGAGNRTSRRLCSRARFLLKGYFGRKYVLLGSKTQVPPPHRKKKKKKKGERKRELTVCRQMT